jgi:hypothetical protein
MVEEMMKEKCGEGDIDAHKSSMSLMSPEEVDNFHKERKKLLIKAERPCKSCGKKGHFGISSWLCLHNTNNQKNIQITEGNIEDDYTFHKDKEKKEAQQKPTKKKKQREGIASLKVSEIKQQLQELGLPVKGTKPVLLKRLQEAREVVTAPTTVLPETPTTAASTTTEPTNTLVHQDHHPHTPHQHDHSATPKLPIDTVLLSTNQSSPVLLKQAEAIDRTSTMIAGENQNTQLTTTRVLDKQDHHQQHHSAPPTQQPLPTSDKSSPLLQPKTDGNSMAADQNTQTCFETSTNSLV